MQKQKEATATNEVSYGEKLVRTKFNPNDDSTVQHIKERAAELINYINDNVADGRHKSLSITRIEEGAMWGVKAATANM